eukprot:jgi/Chlat1/2428/Chrsp17S02676
MPGIINNGYTLADGYQTFYMWFTRNHTYQYTNCGLPFPASVASDPLEASVQPPNGYVPLKRWPMTHPMPDWSNSLERPGVQLYDVPCVGCVGGELLVKPLYIVLNRALSGLGFVGGGNLSVARDCT